MSLVELPAANGETFAVDPHQVTSVQPYSRHVVPREGDTPMCIVWVSGRVLHVCIQSVEHVTALLSDARRMEFDAFDAGYREGYERRDVHGRGSMDTEHVRVAMHRWKGVSG